MFIGTLTISDELSKMKADAEKKIASGLKRGRDKVRAEVLPGLIAFCKTTEECESVYRFCLRVGYEEKALVLVFAIWMSFAKTLLDFQGICVWMPREFMKHPLLQPHVMRFQALVEEEIRKTIEFKEYYWTWKNCMMFHFGRTHPMVASFLEAWYQAASTEEEKEKAYSYFPKQEEALLF